MEFLQECEGIELEKQIGEQSYVPGLHVMTTYVYLNY